MDAKKLEKTLAQKAHVDIKTINNTSLAGVSLTLANQASDIASLFSLVSDLTDEVEALKTKLLNYETHTHSYDDDNGTTTETKTTQGVS